MVSVKSNVHMVRASAWYDLVVTSALMTPWTASLTLNGFALLSSVLALERPVPVLDAGAMLFANLLGSIVIVWSIWRLRQVSRTVGVYDACARILFALWQVVAVAHGASFLILGFTLFEIGFAIAQLLPVQATRFEGRLNGQDRNVTG